jgi:hypothetical protein
MPWGSDTFTEMRYDLSDRRYNVSGTVISESMGAKNVSATGSLISQPDSKYRKITTQTKTAPMYVFPFKKSS